ncbi:MAG: mechanosensitive ion channel domain-containing protein [Rhodospirillales bacterium]
MQEQVQALTKFADVIIEFAVKYGFQILGALVFFIIGIKIAGWCAARLQRFFERKDLDPTLTKFITGMVKILVVVVIVIITLGNFGISIAPLVALAGASVFGATLALQGPLANYGAGLAIILARPFTVGDTVKIKNISGVVQDVSLAATKLIGEDGERITVPNKQIVGEIIVNSSTNRIVETELAIAFDQNVDKAVEAIANALKSSREISEGMIPQVGIHDFSFGGIVLGLRYWVPSNTYFQSRYAVNRRAYAALSEAGVKLVPLGRAAFIADASGSTSTGTDADDDSLLPAR